MQARTDVATAANEVASATASLTGMSVPELISSLGGTHAQCIGSIAAGETTGERDHFDPTAVNHSSDAEGLCQWLLSTWLATPQGRAGLSRLDPVADIEAMAYVLDGHMGGMNNWAGTKYTDGCYSWLPQLARMVR